MKPGPKERLSLAYSTHSDEIGEESRVIYELQRGGHMDLFNQDNPERLRIEAEERPEQEASAARKAAELSEFILQIKSQLTPRQQAIWQCRADGFSFEEIASILDCSERTIYGDWHKIREIVWSLRRPE